MEIKEIIWVLPILFMLHEFEEIIFIKSWINKNVSLKRENHRFKPYENFVSTESFAAAVLEEFIIIILTVTYTAFYQNYTVWYGLMFAFTVHFLPHMFSAIAYKRFVPGVCTAAILLPIGVYILHITPRMFSCNIICIISSCVVWSIVLMLNLKWINKIMPGIEQIISK